jgi:hypothetical protein
MDRPAPLRLQIARNPDPDSKLGFLLRLPVGAGLVFRTSDTWPRTKALYCHPMRLDEWPVEADLADDVELRSCVRRGAAIDLVLDRGRENRSQLVFTQARGRDVVFWQSARTRKQARPNVRTPTARAGGIPDLEIVVDAHERYAWKFAGKPVTTVSRALPCGDYGVTLGDRLVAAVERKSLADLTSSLTNGTLRFALTELAALPRAAVVVEERWSQVFKQAWVRPAIVADGLAELQIRWPNVAIVFCESRPLAEEWTYRYLAAAVTWAETETAMLGRLDAAPPLTRVPRSRRKSLVSVRSAGVPGEVPTSAPPTSELDTAPDAPLPSIAEVRAWARSAGLRVSDRGRLPPDVWAAWREARTD